MDTTTPIMIIADSNIASLDAFFNASTLGQATGQPVNIITVAGRDINAALLAEWQPEILLIRSVTPVDAALLADNKSVQFVGSATIGTDHVDQEYLMARQITFANAAGCSKHSVAQYVLTAILTLRSKYWQQSVTLGIIGLGNIGSTLADYAHDLGWQILGYDPLLPASNINNASLEQVLSQSDVVSLHVPLTSQKNTNTQHASNGSDYPTRHLIDAEALAMMPAHTMLINSARGAVINASDLEADIERTNRQVVLDVFEHEPQIAEPLLSRLAIATPHIAGYTVEGKLRGTQIIYDALCEQLSVAPTQSMQTLLPLNMFLWSELQTYPDRLIKFYDIKQDDAALREKIVDGQVNGADFDQLRRDYHLRREWQS
ncbi:4-phosphoerythronate dehydrogenase [Psychrobacter sp. JB385]|uniref:4-phosphoerythronate dehydrogenase n=1 Tax=Psychrobacter sp. JB385 TaxID=1434841 RepID=UPI00097E9A26|nr:4-phosphoerythronate dehydrogenase [Psychrobacter sp. JB385]SJN44322.1 Erythronate-4-phosphate dehydrogenase [Psychrobacter sp. JB385]